MGGINGYSMVIHSKNAILMRPCRDIKYPWAMAHLAAMDFFCLRYCLIMASFLQPQRAVQDSHLLMSRINHRLKNTFNLWINIMMLCNIMNENMRYQIIVRSV